MATYYKNQNKLEALAKKTGLSLTTNRMSDLMGVLYGGRGNKYDELHYWRHQNTDANPGVIQSVSVAAGGTGYTNNDTLTITNSQGGTSGTLTATVSGGIVTSVAIANAGFGYIIASNLATTGGTGSGCRVNITSIVPFVNLRDSDALTKFATGKSVVGSRADQLERDLYQKNNL